MAKSLFVCFRGSLLLFEKSGIHETTLSSLQPQTKSCKQATPPDVPPPKATSR
jgi:hypothetical protein